MSSLYARPMSIVDPGTCRLCGHTKRCRILNSAYEYMGQKEVYSEMLIDCFGLLVSQLDGAPEERLVCAACVVRLRACLSFKKQVVRCEEQFLKRMKLTEACSKGNTIKHEVLLELEIEKDDRTASLFPADEVIPTSNYKMECDNETESIVIETAEDTSPYEDDLHNSHNPLEEYEVKVESQPFAQPLPYKPTRVRGKKTNISNLKMPSKKTTLSDALKSAVKQKERELRLRQKLDDERTLRMKNILLQRMDKLKELQRKRADQARYSMPTKRAGAGSRRDRMLAENACKIVASSYVCPFNNITGNYYCFYCRSIYAVPHDLREHTLTHDPTTFPRYLSNKKAIKIDLTRIDCRLCEDSVTTLRDLRHHLTAKHDVKLHALDNEFLRFKLTHPTLSCLECGDSFYFVDKLIDHMAEHFGSFICDKCGTAFVQASSLEAHMRCHNDKKKSFECNHCGKSLSTNRARYVHVNTVHEKNPVIDCLKCEDKFFTYDGRNKHMVAVHGHNMTFPCNNCDRVFDSRKKFIHHNQVTHLKAYSHSCQLCDKKFFSSTHMKRHMKTHT